MLGYRRAARGPTSCTSSGLAAQPLTSTCLPRGRPIVLTAHDVLPREPRRGS